jgi:hypothetical protein
MRLFSIGILLLVGVAACAAPAVKPHGLKGGVVEPTYPPESQINCWVQPPHDTLWYPCQDTGQPAHYH